MPFFTHHDPNAHHIPHIGMRKVKSILAIFVGFCLWQLLRLFLPELEVHPIFIYIYGMIEIRETSEKTVDYGKMRILATVTAIIVSLPFMLLSDIVQPLLPQSWMRTLLQISVLLTSTLLVLCAAEWVHCRVYCGLAAAICIILLISHFESSVYLYSVMRAFQTVIGVFVAWFINVKLLPYPPKPGTLSHWLTERQNRTKE